MRKLEREKPNCATALLQAGEFILTAKMKISRDVMVGLKGDRAALRGFHCLFILLSPYRVQNWSNVTQFIL
jgi:hypothetical protein